ncbi:hypothetical protein C8Q73DRAFT_664230 [Cubamyces lactineus]|nr:hypothetical protein C8Q73DRAFT_664230 [Cubamyces lactineus]
MSTVGQVELRSNPQSSLVFPHTTLKQLRNRNPSEFGDNSSPELSDREPSSPPLPIPPLPAHLRPGAPRYNPPTQSASTSRLIEPASEPITAPDPSTLPAPVFGTVGSPAAIPTSAPVPSYAIKIVNWLVSLEPDLAEILGITSLPDPDNHLPDNASFDDLIDKVLEYVKYLEDYIHIYNQPRDHFTIPDDPVTQEFLLSTRGTELFQIKPFYAELLCRYPCLLFHVIHQLTETIRREEQLPTGYKDYWLHYHHPALIKHLKSQPGISIISTYLVFI